MITERTKPNFQPWDETAFNGDDDVISLTPIQRWIYRTLLQKMFVCSARPYLPNDDALLWKLAGCESKEQWMQNRNAVVVLFYEVLGDGNPPLLAQKRVLADWDNFQAKRQMAVERGRRGGTATAAHRNPAPTEYEGGDKGVLDEIRNLYTMVTGKKPEKLLTTQEKRLEELIRIKGGKAVVDAFGQWINEQDLLNQEVPYPIGAFLKEAPTYLALSEAQEPAGGQPDAMAGHPRATLDQLLADLALLSDGKVMFGAARHRAALAVMLRDYTVDEILGQFKLYYDGLEDKNDLRWAAQTFCENGTALLAAHRKAIAEQQEKVRKMDELAAQAKQAAEVDFPTPAPAAAESSPDDDAFFEIEVTR